MDFYKDSCCGARHLPPAALASLPIGFSMALAMNQPAMNAYAAMDEAQKQAILTKAHNVRSQREMQNLVNSLANPTIQ